MEVEHFDYLVEYQLAVCRECQYTVWPDKIEGHLYGKHHKIPRKRAREIADQVCSWPGLIPFASELRVPVRIDRPIPQLPLYKDGLMCRLDPEKCWYICRDRKTLKKHWDDKHQYSVASHRGGSGSAKKQRVEQRFEAAVKRVYCQRFFPNSHGSRYFEVGEAGEEVGDENRARVVIGEVLWDRVCEKAMMRWAEVEKKNRETIQEVQTNEANPWLERTGWSKYLRELNRPELLESIREPNDDPDAEEGEREAVEGAIWKAMGEVAEIGQASTVNRIGVSVRLEAIRTEKHQTRYQPLQPYQDEGAIKDRVQPWKQVLMFFARTQREHDWRSPEYRFTRGQRRAWDELIKEARRVADGGGECGSKCGSSDEEVVDDGESEVGSDDMESDAGIDGEDEINPNQTKPKPKPLTHIQKVCLDFCVALLNQTMTGREYDSALVCALAVLGVREEGWQGPDRYPPILSSVVKVARFMVVQKALEMVGPDGEDEFNDDEPYDVENRRVNEGTGNTRHKGSLQFVADMMDAFMVRGSHGPMQWMLDLRTYGLKIHYNTTATGHVGWQGHDEILYKNVQFNMAQFRSMVHGLVEQCRQLMEEELLFCGGKYQGGEQVPEVPWGSLRDDPTDKRLGWNFLQDQRTRMPVDGTTWLQGRIRRGDAIRQRFLRPGSQSGVNQEGVKAYMRQVVKFQEKLLVLIHITGKWINFR